MPDPVHSLRIPLSLRTAIYERLLEISQRKNSPIDKTFTEFVIEAIEEKLAHIERVKKSTVKRKEKRKASKQPIAVIVCAPKNVPFDCDCHPE